MRVLVVGNGAREHALAWRISRSPSLTRLWVAPGNYGTAGIATNLNVGSGIEALTFAARELAADLVVVGPEAPLADGLADELTSAGIPVFGPTSAAAKLESSKSFAREVMRQAASPVPSSPSSARSPRRSISFRAIQARGWSRPTAWRRARA